MLLYVCITNFTMCVLNVYDKYRYFLFFLINHNSKSGQTCEILGPMTTERNTIKKVKAKKHLNIKNLQKSARLLTSRPIDNYYNAFLTKCTLLN